MLNNFKTQLHAFLALNYYTASLKSRTLAKAQARMEKAVRHMESISMTPMYHKAKASKQNLLSSLMVGVESACLLYRRHPDKALSNLQKWLRLPDPHESLSSGSPPSRGKKDGPWLSFDKVYSFNQAMMLECLCHLKTQLPADKYQDRYKGVEERCSQFASSRPPRAVAFSPFSGPLCLGEYASVSYLQWLSGNKQQASTSFQQHLQVSGLRPGWRHEWHKAKSWFAKTSPSYRLFLKDLKKIFKSAPGATSTP